MIPTSLPREAAETAPAVCAHCDEIGAGGAGRGENFLIRSARADLPGRFDATGPQARGDRRKVLLRVAPTRVDIVDEHHAASLDRHRCDRLEDTQEHDGNIERAGDVHEERQDALGNLRAIERHEDSLIHRPTPPLR